MYGFLDSESESDSSSSPNVKNSQLGALQNICLDNVYMNYLKKKAEEKPKRKKRSNHHKRSKGRSQGPIKDKSSSDSSCSSSPTHRAATNKEVSAKKGEKVNKNQSKGDHLLLNLMQKNVKEGEFTPEQKTLYEAHDVLMDEYKRRKEQRQKVGGMFKRNRRSLKSILQSAMAKGHTESDLQLKARSKDLQNRRKEKKKRNLTSFAAIVDADKI